MRNRSSAALIRQVLDPTVYSLLETSWASPVPPGRSIEWILDHLLVPPPITTLRVNAVDAEKVEDVIATATKLFYPRDVQRHSLLDDVLIVNHDTVSSSEGLPSRTKQREDPRAKECFVNSDRGCSTNCHAATSISTRTRTVAAGQESQFQRDNKDHDEVVLRTDQRKGLKENGCGQLPVILVDRRCGQAVLRGAHVFSGGVLASEPHLRVGEMVEVFTLPGRLHKSKLAVECANVQRNQEMSSIHSSAVAAQPSELPLHGQKSQEADAHHASEDIRAGGEERSTSADKSDPESNGELRGGDCDCGRSEAQNDETEQEHLASVLRGTYLRAALPERVRKTGIFCGRGIIRQNLGQVYAGKPGIAVEMESAIDLSTLPACLVAQNLPSIVVGHVLSPQPGERVLDMCAAPGGKTLHLATLMKGHGLIVAVERSKTRAEKLRSFLSTSSHASIVEIVCGDSAKGTWQSTQLGMGSHGRDFIGYFDRVLADVPCTALGLRPRIDFEGLTDRVVLAAAKYQREFLKSGCQLLKTGGTLVYSTCSVSRAENEENVAWALRHLPLMLEPAEPFVGTHTFENGDRGARLFPPGEAEKLQRFCPSGNTIGFFIAKFLKTGTG
ncbi:NOL1/NOP2/sun family protein [Toxoplasma gondii GT1]|uniref:NOL1/NOP2/sun family protein n=2 Tax=Toxoplasma gondii TaxID=5811 RepID=S7US02_TOXGG|nr:NOL1/NOP2/sun family protein [Toxoplasma gondii GT1]KAF4639069.1 NOL1/NOP2/sun family protein [Toxoplasma gondii]